MRNIKLKVWDEILEWFLPIEEDSDYMFIYTKDGLELWDNGRKKDGVAMLFSTGVKDSKGKDIYSGDIVHYDTEDGTVRAKVVFEISEEENMNISGFKYEFVCHEDYVNGDEGVDLEVIGNIYENKELLEPLAKTKSNT